VLAKHLTVLAERAAYRNLRHIVFYETVELEALAFAGFHSLHVIVVVGLYDCCAARSLLTMQARLTEITRHSCPINGMEACQWTLNSAIQRYVYAPPVIGSFASL
jgi:hypothetical protein